MWWRYVCYLTYLSLVACHRDSYFYFLFLRILLADVRNLIEGILLNFVGCHVVLRLPCISSVFDKSNFAGSITELESLHDGELLVTVRKENQITLLQF